MLPDAESSHSTEVRIASSTVQTVIEASQSTEVHISSDEDCSTTSPTACTSEACTSEELPSSDPVQTHPKVCRNREQFETWCRSRDWLLFDVTTGGVKCASCSQVKRLCLHTEPGQHNEAAFVNGTVHGKDAKTLLKKIDKHRDSQSHKKCVEILSQRERERIEAAVRNAESLFCERHKDNIAATAKVFRTAYECAKSHLPYSEHTRLVELQSLNGINCGNILYSYHACSNIISHIAGEMRSEIIKHIVNSHSRFSIIVDESTSVANIQSMIVYIRTQFDGHVCTYFLGLLELSSATAEGLEKSLIDFLHDVGLTDDVLCAQFIGFCSDGASCMIGEHKGVATLLKARFPLLQTMHCMAHRLELAVKKSVDTVNAVSHFKIFVDEMYKVYSMSPKNQRELLYEAETLSVELLKVQKIFDVRWVFSSFVAVKAVLRDYAALYAHFTKCSSGDSGRTTKEKSKYRGLATKMHSWLFVSETCMLKDSLRCLKHLSLYLQGQEANIMNAATHIQDTITKLQALKRDSASSPANSDTCMTSLGKFIRSFEADQQYKGVDVQKKTGDDEHFNSLRQQFLQALCDNLQQRFPATDLLVAAGCLNQATWPADALDRALFGEKHIASICKLFGIASAEAADVVREYATFKQTDGRAVGKKLHELMFMLTVLPISSADCERGFSQMNLYHSSGRNRLLTASVSDMLMIGINGPPLASWNADKYVMSWLKSGKHGALDKATGLAKKPHVVQHSSKLFV